MVWVNWLYSSIEHVAKHDASRASKVLIFRNYLNPIGARSKFWGVSGSEDRGGGDNSIQFINFGRGWQKS